MIVCLVVWIICFVINVLHFANEENKLTISDVIFCFIMGMPLTVCLIWILLNRNDKVIWRRK